MVLVAAAGLLTWGLSGLSRTPMALSGKGGTGLALKGGAVVALLLWTAIIFAGRWIGYTEGWPGAPQ
jgi:hypothetical protein